MSDEKQKRERSEVIIRAFPNDTPSNRFIGDKTVLDGLIIEKTFYTRVAAGRKQFKQTVTFDFMGCTYMTLAEYAITALGIEYQDTCRSKDSTLWPQLEAELEGNPNITLRVADGLGTKRRGTIATVTRMTDEDFLRVFELEKQRRGPSFAALLK